MRRTALGLAIAALVAGVSAASTEPPAAGPGDQPRGSQLVLDTHSYWRVFVTLRPPLWGTAADAKVQPERIAKLPPPSWQRDIAGDKDKSREKPMVAVMPPDQPASELPPADWAGADFDDRGWWRDPGPFFGGAGGIMQLFYPPHASRYGHSQTIALALLCARGKFTVGDPAAVASLALSLEFRGGAVVYLNGVEVARSHLPAGPIALETLADDYPLELSLVPEDKRRHKDRVEVTDGGKCPEVAERRIRRLTGVALPTKLLRKGVNVLAIEIHRAALNEKIADLTYGHRLGNVWNTVGLQGVELRAGGAGASPNVARPAGVQAWNSTVAEAAYDADYGDPNEPLGPIAIVAARNGAFSGQLVVGSDQAIEGLTAEVSGPLRLVGGQAELPADGVKVLWPVYGRYEMYSKSAVAGTDGQLRTFDELFETPPDVVPARQKRRNLSADRAKPQHVPIPIGATQPIWVQVQVPADAAAGVYEGTLAVRSKSSPTPLTAPIRVTVCPWTLPAPADYVTWPDFIQSPDSLALRYEAPLWSDKHWALIRRTFRLLASAGNKTLYVPLIAHTHFGNEQSMVRFVRRPDGRFDPDFTAMERYLDEAKLCGLRPEAVIFYVWDYSTGHLSHELGRWGHLGVSNLPPGFRPAVVTEFDPTVGGCKTIDGPAYNDPSAEAFWAPVGAGIRDRLKARGLLDAAMVGICGDSIPQKEVVAVWKKVLPEARWMARTHLGSHSLHGEPLGYRSLVVTTWAVDPAVARAFGWQNRNCITYFPRIYSDVQQTFNRLCWEWNLQSGRRGVGQLAGDFLRYGVRNSARVTNRYPGGSWANISLREAWLGEGPDGAVNTVRFDLAREGIQECEARIFIEKALTDAGLRARLPAGLADRCQRLLDQRTRELAWACEYVNVFSSAHSFLASATNGVLGSDWYAGGDRWQRRSRALFDAAGEVASALEGN